MRRPATLSPARPERLRWLEPPVPVAQLPTDLQPRLEALLAQGGCPEVYAAHRRSVYRTALPGCGEIAIKELRNPWPPRQLWFGWLAEHPGVREYRIGNDFAARGGRTLRALGAALESSPFGLARVFLVTRWLEGAVTLTRWLAERKDPPDTRLLATLAAQITGAARLGLVHHRHSSNNLLVVMERGEPVLYTIDFPHATLGPGLDRSGLALDTARIARWLLRERIWSRESVQGLFEAVAAEVGEAPPGRAELLARMSAELEAVIRDPGARRPAA
jgi:hypothetical protein